MRAWLATLQPRERWIVLGGAVAALVIIAWGFILRPLHRQGTELQDTVAQKQRLLVNVRTAERIGPADSAARGQASQQSLFVLVDTTRQPHGLDFRSTRPEGADGINVSFQNASFDALLNWLVALDTTHGVRVETASFTSTRERGLVNGQVLLRRL
jgi:type II secretory pathway component PulM